MDNLGDSEYTGIVVDNKDPNYMGGCRIRVDGLFDTLEESHIPMAYPSNNYSFAGGGSGGFGVLSVPKIGTRVRLRFNNGDMLAPEYFGPIDINESLQKELSASYTNAKSLMYDEDEEVKILYTQENGLKQYHKGSHITIDPDSSILLEHKDSKSMIQLDGNNMFITANTKIEITSQTKIECTSSEIHINGIKTNIGSNPIYSAVNGEPTVQCLEALAALLDLKWSPTPGAAAAIVASFRELILSKTVKTSP